MSDVLMKTPRRVLRRWGQQEILRANEMRKDDQTLEHIAGQLNRPISSVHHILRKLRDGPDVIESAPEISTSTFDPIPDAVLEDRERRYLIQPRDLVASIAGDPLPGYSALDRKQS